MQKLKGRPNQGKTDTIRERCVNVYLPTKELVHQWRIEADKAGMPLSRFIFEVVERHRRNTSENLIPNWKLEERTNELESQLADLQSKYTILNLAFEHRENEVRNLSDALEKVSRANVDTTTAQKMVKAFYRADMAAQTVFELMREMGVDDSDEEGVAKVRETLTLFCEIGLIQPSGMDEWRWRYAFKKPHHTKTPNERKATNAARKHQAAERVQRGLHDKRDGSGVEE